MEFSARPEVETIADTLAERGLDVRKQGEEPPTNVGIAGQSGIAVGDIRADRNNPRAIWIWAAADNFRIVADSVTALLSQLEAPAA
mgnify:FL=1